MFDSYARVMQALKKIAGEEVSKSYIVGSEGFQSLRRSVAGTPVLVYSPEDKPEFWIVPYISSAKAYGFALFDERQNLIRIGVFGSGGDDGSSIIDSSYFVQPPPRIMDEIRTKYSGYSISKPVFSYDKIPAKWSWRLNLKKNNERVKSLYILPGSWYETVGKNEPGVGMEG